MPVLPTVHYNMGGMPTNYHGEVLTLKDGNPDYVVPGLMAIGEAACVSVHGANRLGSNSLIDLVVFGRAAGLQCAKTIEPGTLAAPTCPSDAAELALSRLDKFRHAKGGTPTAALRLRDAEDHADQLRGVPHGPVLEEGVQKITEVWKDTDDIRVSDRSLVWNSDLIETLEYDNLIVQAAVTVVGAANRTRKPRRARARGLPQARRRQLDEAHAGLGRRRHPHGAHRLPPGAHLHHDQRGQLHPAQGAGVLSAVIPVLVTRIHRASELRRVRMAGSAASPVPSPLG